MDTGRDANQQRRDELADLAWHWGRAYTFAWHDDAYHATRTSTGRTFTAPTAGELHTRIDADYNASPAPRP